MMRGLMAPIVVVAALLGVALLGASLIGVSAAPQQEWKLVERQCPVCRYVNAVDHDLWFWSCSRCGRWHMQSRGRVEDKP